MTFAVPAWLNVLMRRFAALVMVACSIACNSTNRADTPPAAAEHDAAVRPGSEEVRDAAPGSRARTPSSSGAAVRTAPGRSPAGAGTRSGPAAAAAGAVPGVTAKTIKVGVLYASSAEAELNALGGSGSRGDERKAYEILFDDLNKRGGILGRRIVPSFYEVAFGDSRPREQVEQAPCEQFTGDNRVFAVLTSKAGGSTDSFKQCLERKKIVHLGANFTTAGGATYRKFPHFAEPSGLAIERAAGALTGSLTEQRYFTGWNSAAGEPGPVPVAVGIVTLDYPTFATAVDGKLVPALKRAKVNIADIARITTTGDPTAQIAAAVLRFRQRGVTHAVFFSSAGTIPLLFITQAHSQGYRPRYASTSQDVLPLLVEAGVVPDPASELRGMVGMGWWPSADTSYGRNPYSARPAAKRCLDTLRKGGERPDSALQETLAYIHCDLVNFLEVSLRRGGPRISPQSFVAGVAKVGSSFSPNFTISSRFSTTRRDGVAQYRNFQFFSDCRCFRHAGPARSVP